MSTDRAAAKINWSLVKSIFFGVGGVYAASGLLLVVVNWAGSRIDSAVERKLSDPKILRQIAAEARPTVVFDANESITADLGGAQFIKNITITREDKEPAKGNRHRLYRASSERAYAYAIAQ